MNAPGLPSPAETVANPLADLAIAGLTLASDHPVRRDLANEVHARPFLRIQAPARVTHVALLAPAGAESASHAKLAGRLCRALGIPAPAESESHYAYQSGDFQIKMERHIEFSSFTVVDVGDAVDPFSAWFVGENLDDPELKAMMAQKRLVAIQVEVRRGSESLEVQRDHRRWFVSSSLVGSRVLGGGEVWCDWRIGHDGFSRFLVLDIDFRENQVGRLVQRLTEIETYRLMAMLALPVARDLMARLEALDASLAEVMRGMSDDRNGADDALRLHALTGLAATMETLSGSLNRFAASRAYDRLVTARIGELREVRIEGVPTIGEFMERRLTPAMDTCRAVQQRQIDLAARVARAIDLLRTRVSHAQEGQVTALLAGMNRTATTQLKLQHAVEGLSVVAISYYVVSLSSHLFSVLEKMGVARHSATLELVLVPCVVAVTWFTVRGVRRRLADT